MSRKCPVVTVASLAAVSVPAFHADAAVTIEDRVRTGAPNQYVIRNAAPSDQIVVGLLVRRTGTVDGIIGTDSPTPGEGTFPAWDALGFIGGFDASDEWEDQFLVDSYTPSMYDFFGLEWEDVAPDANQTLTAYFLSYANGDPFGTPFFIEPDDAIEEGETSYALQYNSTVNRGAGTELLLLTASVADGLGDPGSQPGGYGYIAVDGAFGIPTPGTAALLALGGVSVLRRRR